MRRTRLPPGCEGYIRLSAARKVDPDVRPGDTYHQPRLTHLTAFVDGVGEASALKAVPDRRLLVVSDEEFDGRWPDG